MGTTNNDNNNNNKNETANQSKRLTPEAKDQWKKYLKFPNFNRTQRHRIIEPKEVLEEIVPAAAAAAAVSERVKSRFTKIFEFLQATKKTTRVSILASKKQYTKITFLRLFSFSAFQPRFHLLGRD